MPEVNVIKQDGGQAGTLSLGTEVFDVKREKGAVVVREVYNAYRTNQRQGTHSTKTRGTIRGGGRKPWRQKGTGRARHGSIRSNIWRGGAVAFGPLPREYREKVSKKKRRLAYRVLLSAKLEAGEIIVLEGLDFPAASKTRDLVAFREKIGAKGKTLILCKEKSEGLVRAGSNLAGSSKHPTRVQLSSAVSIFDLLTCDTLIATKDAIADLEERLK